LLEIKICMVRDILLEMEINSREKI